MRTKSYNVQSAEARPTNGQPLLLDSASQLSSHNSPNNTGKNEAEEAIVTSCGIGSWRPPWLQMFATPMFFMLNMALVGIIQGMTGTLFFSSISTFEKRYAFDSKISGVILIADNFAEMIVSSTVHCIQCNYN